MFSYLSQSSSYETITLILQVVSSSLLLISVIFVYRRVREMRASTFATAYKAAIDILQNDEIRSARKYVFTKLKQKAFNKWNNKDIAEAEKVCQAYDAVGQMVRAGMLLEEYIVDNWKAGLKESWTILSPLVTKYREERNSLNDWDDYEYLAKKAIYS